jgi:hypothetical protein
MADARSRRTGEHDPQLIALMADAASMREAMDALAGRVLRLEAELAALRAGQARPAAAAGVTVPPRPTSKRPAPLGPPPLPADVAARPSSQPRKAAGARNVVDISEIAELVDSVPPPPRAPRR